LEDRHKLNKTGGQPIPGADHATCSRILVRTRGRLFAHPVITVTSPIVAKSVIKGLAASGNGETIQVFSGGEAFASGPAVRDMALGAISSVERVRRVAEHCSVYVALHADHCQPKNPDKVFLPPVPENEKHGHTGLSSLSNNPMSDGSGIRS
jgi:fructose-bisphosphate aldolase class II